MFDIDRFDPKTTYTVQFGKIYTSGWNDGPT
jgi:hypothetical protein